MDAGTAEARRFNGTTSGIVGAESQAQRAPGSGVLESACEGRAPVGPAEGRPEVEQQEPLPAGYSGIRFDRGGQAPPLVDGEVIVEIKAVRRAALIRQARLPSYVRLCGLRAGLPVDGSVEMSETGTRRPVNEYPGSPHFPRAPRAIVQEDAVAETS
jgi:GxxExxY protein